MNNGSGRRFSTVEIDNALQGAEAAVIGRSHDTKGEELVGFVILADDTEYSDEFMSELRDHVGEEAGDIAEGEELGDTSTLSNPDAAETIQQQAQKQMQ